MEVFIYILVSSSTSKRYRLKLLRLVCNIIRASGGGFCLHFGIKLYLQHMLIDIGLVEQHKDSNNSYLSLNRWFLLTFGLSALLARVLCLLGLNSFIKAPYQGRFA